MSPNPKMNREPVEETPEIKQIRNDFASLFLHGIERVADFQKKAIDLAVQQNAEIVDVFKQNAEKLPGFQRLPLLDVMSDAFAQYADTQKSAIDLVVEQSQVWTDVFKDRAKMAGQSVKTVTNLTKQAMERSAAVQKKALECTAANAKATVNAARQQFGFSGSAADAVTETFQNSVDTIVDAQKELLDLVTH